MKKVGFSDKDCKILIIFAAEYIQNRNEGLS